MFFFFKQKTAYDVRISDWSSDVCSSDLGHEELGLGAVVDGADPQLVLNEDIVRDLAPSPNYLHAEMQRQLAEITRRREMYMHGIPPIDVARRTVILVDDGIATGRSEEHTSELQSLMRISYAVFCLKKKKQTTKHNHAQN